jgi:hypothetical protein
VIFPLDVEVIVPPPVRVISPDIEILSAVIVPVNVGDALNTNRPDPVSSVTADARFALEGVARNVATPEASPVILLNGSPVQFVSIPEAGVPSAGVINVGEVSNTNFPVPVVPVALERYSSCVVEVEDGANNPVPPNTTALLFVTVGAITP